MGDSCDHCGHRRDDHEYVLGSECRKCSCAGFLVLVEDEGDEEMPKKPTNKSLEEARTKATALRERVKAIREEMEKSEATMVALVRPFIPDPEEDEDREPLSDSLVIPGSWDCTDVRNPAGTCVYDDENDECHDNCLFCGHPEERY